MSTFLARPPPTNAVAAAAARADGGWPRQSAGRLFHGVCPPPSAPAETTATPPTHDKHHDGRPTNPQPPPTPAPPVPHVDNIHEVTKKPFVAKGPHSPPWMYTTVLASASRCSRYAPGGSSLLPVYLLPEKQHREQQQQYTLQVRWCVLLMLSPVWQQVHSSYCCCSLCCFSGHRYTGSSNSTSCSHCEPAARQEAAEVVHITAPAVCTAAAAPCVVSLAITQGAGAATTVATVSTTGPTTPHRTARTSSTRGCRVSKRSTRSAPVLIITHLSSRDLSVDRPLLQRYQ